MKLKALLVILQLITIAGFAQTVTTNYYKDEYLSKLTDAKKGNYKEVITIGSDGVETKEVYNLSTAKLIQAHRGSEPIKVWTTSDGKSLDYNFKLGYDDMGCPGDKDSFTMKEGKSPELVGDENIIGVIGRHLRYPQSAIDNGITGTVYLYFTVDGQGNVGQINVMRGVDPALDKEAARVIRLLKFKPSKAIAGTCYNVPVKFMIR